MPQPVCIYADAGASMVGVASLLAACEARLGRPCRQVNAQAILQGVLDDCALLIMPGGADMSYCAKLNGVGNRRILQFVEQGGCYVGICAGAYYACRQIDFEGEGYRIAGARELALFNGTAKGSLPALTGGRLYAEGATASKAMVPLRFAESMQEPSAHYSQHYYYHGGPAFIADTTAASAAETIAYYPDGAAAVASGKYGQGSYLLSGVHFELQAAVYDMLVCQTAAESDRAVEQELCRHFTADYGARIWQAVGRLLQ